MTDTQRRLILVVLVIAAAALMRILPHPPNVSPIAAMALFAGAQLADRRLAYLVPFSAMLLSDLVLGFHGQMGLVYGSFAAMVWLGGRIADRQRALPVLAATLGGTAVFFLVTNLGVWAFDGLYPRTWDGLVICYVAALPFLQNSLLGNLLYAALLFGGWRLAERRLPFLRRASSGLAAA
jgi:hypothetical protein